MRLYLMQVVSLLQQKSPRALPFEQGIDPSVDLQWIFLGFDPVPGPRYLQTAGWEGCHYRARAQATRAVQQSADAPWGSQWGCRDRDNGAAVPCRSMVYLDGPIRYMTSPATVVASKPTKKAKASKAAPKAAQEEAKMSGSVSHQRLVIDGQLKAIVERFTEEGGIIYQVCKVA